MKEISYHLFQNSELLPLFFLCFLISFVILYLFSFKKNEEQKTSKLTKKDLRNILVLMLTYGLISLWMLGSTSFPTTSWQPTTTPQDVIFDLGDTVFFNRIVIVYGEGDNNSNPDDFQIGYNDMVISASDNLTNWQQLEVINDGKVYDYNTIDGNWQYRYIKFTSTNPNDSLSEIGIYDSGIHQYLPIELVEDKQAASAYPASLLIDEQSKLAAASTYYHHSYFDEIFHVRNAWEIANGQRMYYSVHPLLGTKFIALSIQLFGMHPFAWRLPGAIAGILMIPIFYLIVKVLFEESLVSLLATAIFTFDFMHMTTSRIATLEPFSILFILLMFYPMLLYYKFATNETPLSKQLKWLFFSGLFLALGIAVKWTACYSAIGLAILFFINAYKRYQDAKNTKLKLIEQNESEQANQLMNRYQSDALIIFACCLFIFILMPIIIYFLSFIGASVWREGYSFSNVWDHTLGMYDYHKNLQATHPFQSTWWQWLLDLRPIWYHFSYDVEGAYHTIACFSHPLLTWVGLPAMIFTLYEAMSKKDQHAWFILIGFFTALLPWALFVDRCVFAYHFYPTSLFIAMAIAYLFKNFSKNTIIIFISIYILIFVVYLPVLTGFSTNVGYIQLLEILESWAFG